MADDTKIKDQSPADQSTNTQVWGDLNLNFDDLDVSTETKTEVTPQAEVKTETWNTNIDFSELWKDINNSEAININNTSEEKITEKIPAKPIIEEKSVETPTEQTTVEEKIVEPIVEEVVAETPTEPVVEEAIVEEIKTESATPSTWDDRLAKEDKIVEEKVTEWNEGIPQSKKENINVTKTTPKDETSFDMKKTDLEEDQKIIDDLTSSKDNTTTVDTVTKTPNIETQQTGSSFDLDSILASHTEPTITTPEPIPTMETPVVVEAPVMTPVVTEVQNPIPEAQMFWPNMPPTPSVVEPIIQEIPSPVPGTEISTTITPPIAASVAPIKKSHKKRKVMTFFLFIVVGWIFAYVIKTMYPLEYENLKINVLSIIGQSPETNDQQGLEELLIATWDIQTDTLEPEIWIPEEIVSWELETDFNAFEDLDAIMTGMDPNPIQSKDTLTQLKEFADEATTFLELGKKINDKVMIKYSVYIERKATELIQSIENGEEIDNTKVESYLAQFSGYLQQLTTLSYDSTDTPTEPIVQTGWEVIPEETNDEMIQDIDWETDTEI